MGERGQLEQNPGLLRPSRPEPGTQPEHEAPLSHGARRAAHGARGVRSADFGVLAAVQHEVGVAAIGVAVVAALWLCDVAVLAAV
jgi:hypothetical protein